MLSLAAAVIARAVAREPVEILAMCAAPNQAERQKCWSARDEFWKCLDANVKEPLKCLEERDKFEGSCSKTWVKYFDRRREYLKFKEKLEKGEADPVDQVKL